MKIKDTTITLDMDKITLHSSSPRNVELPSTGKLPADLEATAARIIFNIQAGQPPKVSLVTIRNGKKDIYPVEITAEEIKAILGQMFNNPTASNPGLDPYWLGVWQTNFNTWRNLHSPHGLMAAMLDLTTPERESFVKLMKQIVV